MNMATSIEGTWSARRLTLFRLAIASAAACAAAFAAPSAFAQSTAWPDKPIRIIVPFAPGGLPDVPTLAKSGYPDMLDYTWVGVFMPAGTSPAVVNRLVEAVRRILQGADIKDRVAGLAFDVIAEPPARTADYVKAEVVRWGEVVKKTGVKPD